jgi:hypothetical protein
MVVVLLVVMVVLALVLVKSNAFSKSTEHYLTPAGTVAHLCTGHDHRK